MSIFDYFLCKKRAPDVFKMVYINKNRAESVKRDSFHKVIGLRGSWRLPGHIRRSMEKLYPCVPSHHPWYDKCSELCQMKYSTKCGENEGKVCYFEGLCGVLAPYSRKLSNFISTFFCVKPLFRPFFHVFSGFSRSITPSKPRKNLIHLFIVCNLINPAT